MELSSLRNFKTNTMKKVLRSLILLLFVVLAHEAKAQMSEAQIVDYVKTQTAAGASQKQIATDLVAKGVTVEQIQRLRDKYSMQDDASPLPSSSAIADRTRTANGEQPLVTSAMTETETSGKKIFGHDIFRSQQLSFEPSMNIPTPTDYVLGPGDEVILDVYGSSQFSSTCKISPDGSIAIPDEGLVFIAGMTSRQAQAKVRQAIGGHYAGSEIRLSVGQTRTIVVHVLGEVKTPGTYSLSAFSNVYNALYLSGGVNDIGTLRDIQVSRNGRVIAHVDIYDFIVYGRLTGNVMLKDNDVIRISPYKNLVKVEGNIKRPMYYEMKNGESLKSLLDFAGGFTGDAYKEKVRIERRSFEGLTVHNVDEFDFGSFHNEDGDVVVVQPIIERFKNTVNVEGAVFRPGKYKLGGDVNSVKSLVEQAGGLNEKAVTSLAVLLRMKENRTTETIALPLGDILNGKTPDVVLQNEDNLIIASTEIRDNSQKLAIYGEVFSPGEYSYSSGETVATLITRAGGLKESALTTEVEVARRIICDGDNKEGKEMAKIFTVTLANGISADSGNDLKLEPYDIVTVMKSPNYKEQRMVHITGEVKKAGVYALSHADERLSDIIKRAGGLTVNAFAGGVQITRDMTAKERKLLELELETAKTRNDSLRIETLMQKSTYIVGTDVEAALRNPGSTSDLVIMENDIINVPQFNNTVKISGEVLSPSTVNYDEGRSVSYYLNEAGGVSKTGRKSQAYIIYANGKKSRASKGKVLPGCEIVVPVKEKKEINPQTTSMWLGMGSTLASIAAVIAAIVK